MLLKEMIPILPNGIVFVSIILFTSSLLSFGWHVSHAYRRWIVCVFAFFSISMLWALEKNLCRWVLILQMLPMFIATITTYVFLTKTSHGIRKILWTYIIASIILILFIIINLDQIEEGIRLGKQLNESVDNENQIINSNSIGMCLCFTIYAGYILFVKGNRKLLIKLSAFIVAAVILWLILLTGSRKAFFMLVIPLIILPLFGKNRGWRKFIFPVTFGIVVVGYNLIMTIPALYDVLGRRIVDMQNILMGTTTGTEDISRMVLVEYGLEWFKDSPVLGHGINNFRVLSNQTPMFMGMNFYAHNNYIELLVDVGIVGFIIYYSCYFYFWKRLKRNIVNNPLKAWIITLIVVRLFLDMAQVSYYSFMSNLILCLCFYAVDFTRKGEVKNKIIHNSKYETSRYNPALQH